MLDVTSAQTDFSTSAEVTTAQLIPDDEPVAMATFLFMRAGDERDEFSMVVLKNGPLSFCFQRASSTVEGCYRLPLYSNPTAKLIHAV